MRLVLKKTILVRIGEMLNAATAKGHEVESIVLTAAELQQVKTQVMGVGGTLPGGFQVYGYPVVEG